MSYPTSPTIEKDYYGEHSTQSKITGMILFVSTAFSLGHRLGFRSWLDVNEQVRLLGSNSAFTHLTAEHFSAHALTDPTLSTLS